MADDSALSARPTSVAGSVNGTSESRLLMVVLAAGASRRLGQPKQLVLLGGESLLRRQCRLALETELGPVAVILGCHADECAATIADLPVVRHINERWAEGLGASIRLAARAAVANGAAGLLLMHVDQYRLTAADLHLLRAAWMGSHCLDACVANHGADFGPPVIFPRDCFAKLLKLDGDAGAHRVLAALPANTLRRVEVPNALHDLDLPADLAAFPEHDRDPFVLSTLHLPIDRRDKTI
jgi:CTP:molybdopterin cytidylyltransferase MocA